MKRQIIPIIKSTSSPTASENIAAGHPLGQKWFRSDTGDEYLHKTDGVWVAQGAVGDVVGPSLVVDENIAVFDTTTGKVIKDGGKKISDLIPKTQNQLTKDPTGFTEPSLVVITGDSINRTVTLTGDVAAYYRGELIPELITGWVSPVHGTTTTDIYFLGYDGTSIAWRNTPWTFDYLQIAIAKYNITNSRWKYYRECHGLMNWQTHKELHETIGTYKSGGGAIPSASYVLLSTTAANRRPNIDLTTISDEDLQTSLPALTTKLYTQFSLTGVAIESNVLDAADIVPLTGNNPNYNSFSTPNWIQTLMPNNSVATVWVYAQPMAADAISQKYRYLFVQPQWITQATSGSAGNLTTATNTEKLRSSSELNLNGLLATEIVAIARITIAYTSSNWNIRDISLISGSKQSQITAVAGGGITSVVTDTTLTGNGTGTSPLGFYRPSLTEALGYAMSDNATDITVGVKVSDAAIPYNFTMTGIRAKLGRAFTGEIPLILDIKINTVSIFTTKPTFDSGETMLETAAIPFVLTATSYALLTTDIIELSVTQAGGITTGARNLTLFLIGYKTI